MSEKKFPPQPPRSDEEVSFGDDLPILPIRNAVLFPAAVVPINVGRARSVRLVEDLTHSEVRLIAVVTQRTPETEDPGLSDLYTTGTVARIVKVIKLGASNVAAAVAAGLRSGWLLAP